MRKLFIVCIGLVLVNNNFAQTTLVSPEPLRINQLGYYPDAPKSFVVADLPSNSFSVKDTTGNTVFTGNLSAAKVWKASGENIQTGIFTSLTKPGKYYIELDNKTISHKFEITKSLYAKANKAALKSYYFQRASMPIEERYAGIYARPMGHPDTLCYFHPSSGFSEGVLSSPKGWYDAGDYNKYVVNAAIPVCMLLQLHEMFPNAFPDESINIPESGNKVSDLLDEVRYELEWLLTMQNKDGGVFFKLSHLGFDGFALPHKSTDKRYIIGKSTTSALCFAAMMAKAYRSYKNIDNGFANTMLAASERAWNWAVAHPNVEYKNPADVITGEYGDKDFKGEFFLAASELYVTTHKVEYLNVIDTLGLTMYFHIGDNWKQYLPNLGYYTLISEQSPLSVDKKDVYKKRLFYVADSLVKISDTIPYVIPINRFTWGSNSDVADAAVLLQMAHIYSGNRKYLDVSCEIVDYIFGKNATGYSFLTGFGSKPSMNPHHRLSGGDGITEPLPGFLIGGPNSDKNDETISNIKYPFKEPARAYVDLQSSFASNEIAINWNAPLVFALTYLEHNKNK